MVSVKAVAFFYLAHYHPKQAGGVFLARGVLNITGGNFSGNEGSDQGGVIKADEESTVNLFDGDFQGNEALDGGVVFVDDGAILNVRGGNYTGNIARNGGGAFWGAGGGDVEVITNNSSVFLLNPA